MGSVTTDTFVGREGGAPATPDSGLVALYFKSDGKPYIKDDTGTEEAILTNSVSEGDKVLVDNLAIAWQVKEGTNPYLLFDTRDGAEIIQLGDSGTVAALRLQMEAGTVGWDMVSQGQALIDAVGVVELNSSTGVISIGNDDVDQNINIGTDGDRTVTVGVSDAASQLDLNAGTAGMNLVTTGDMDLSIKDNGATAWLLHEGAQNYILLNTTDGSEAMSFGNASSNPLFSFLGSGQVDFAGPVDMNAAFTGTGAFSYNQSIGTFTYNVGAAIYDIAACAQFQAIAGGGAADAIRLQATAGGGFDFDAGTNGYVLDSSGPVLITGPDNAAVMWQVKEGANSYLKAISTNGSELLELGKTVAAQADVTVAGLLTTAFGTPSGLPATAGGTVFIQDDVSNVVTNTMTPTLFNKESPVFPANSFVPGRRLRIHASGVVLGSESGTEALTLRVRLHTDTGPVDMDIMSIVATDTNTGDIWEFDIWVTVRASGSTTTRTLSVSGGSGLGAPGVFPLDRQKFANAADFNSTLAWKVQVEAEWVTSAQAANQVRMDDLLVELH
jgi:hypothetical protein